MTRGRFITLEGGEGAGKTTQRAMLAERLRALGLTVVETREPGGTPEAEALRALLIDPATAWDERAELLLLYAARIQHVTNRIRPALARGEWVICDRFADSSMAYQGYGLGLGPKLVRQIHDFALGAFKPDLTLILDLPVADGFARAAARGAAADRYESLDRDFHERLRQGFLAIAKGSPKRCRVIDAMPGPAAVADAIWAAVAPLAQR